MRIKNIVNTHSTRSSLFTIHYALVVVLLTAAILVAGCGYHNPYVIHESSIPTTVLYVDIWPNRTNELGLESKIFRSLTSWFRRSKKINTTKNREKADLLLEGEIVSISLPGLSYGLNDQAVEVKAILTVRYALKEKKGGKILWEVPRQIFEEAVVLGTDAAETRGNKQKALAEISDDLAEIIYLRTLNMLTSNN